jgi:chorismate lyase/3-hydroxybenzoate synthase
MLRYASVEDLPALRRDASGILAEIHFGASATPVAVPRHPLLTVPMAQLGANPLVELWTSKRPVEYGRFGNLHYALNDAVLFGVIGDPVSAEEPAFEERVYALYGDLFQVVDELGFPHLLRAWNYFSGINRHCAGLENYQRFCRGRSLAFQARYGEFVGKLPSASAVGTHGVGTQLYFLAAREGGSHRENPRQVSAYRYPAQYGPRSPSFARATFKRWGASDCLYISGTASIVGHESRHAGNLAAQLDETLRNIEALLRAVREEEGTAIQGFADIAQWKVYLRDAPLFPQVQAKLAAVAGPRAEILYLHGDICRADLLVEIEALARSP